MLAEGKTNKEIAGVLNLSVYTVDAHRAASWKSSRAQHQRAGALRRAQRADRLVGRTIGFCRLSISRASAKHDRPRKRWSCPTSARRQSGTDAWVRVRSGLSSVNPRSVTPVRLRYRRRKARLPPRPPQAGGIVFHHEAIHSRRQLHALNAVRACAHWDRLEQAIAERLAERNRICTLVILIYRIAAWMIDRPRAAAQPGVGAECLRKPRLARRDGFGERTPSARHAVMAAE